MIKHKKRFTLFVTLLLSLLLALCSCGTYNPATGGWFGGGNSGGTSGGTSDDPVIDYTDEDLFSVTLKMNGGDWYTGKRVYEIDRWYVYRKIDLLTFADMVA